MRGSVDRPLVVFCGVCARGCNLDASREKHADFEGTRREKRASLLTYIRAVTAYRRKSLEMSRRVRSSRYSYLADREYVLVRSVFKKNKCIFYKIAILISHNMAQFYILILIE